MKKTTIAIALLFLTNATGACAAEGGKSGSAAPMSKDQPIEISSDKLDVLQADHKAIFTGNVIAVQGTTNMRAAEMTVFYNQDDGKSKAAVKPAADKDSGVQGITRIEATGNVVFTTPLETAQGDTAIYNVETDTIDLMGRSVTLTRDKNVLKGTKLNYNMASGRSVLTGGSAGAADVSETTGSKPARVHGLFVPKSDPSKQKADKP